MGDGNLPPGCTYADVEAAHGFVDWSPQARRRGAALERLLDLMSKANDGVNALLAALEKSQKDEEFLDFTPCEQSFDHFEDVRFFLEPDIAAIKSKIETLDQWEDERAREEDMLSVDWRRADRNERWAF